LVLAAPVYWCGSLTAGLWWPLVYVGIVLGIAVSGPLRRFGRVRWVVAAVAVLAALALLVDTDLHGGALAVALAVALPWAEPLATNRSERVG
jgi:hypothetical protein